MCPPLRSEVKERLPHQWRGTSGTAGPGQKDRAELVERVFPAPDNCRTSAAKMPSR